MTNFTWEIKRELIQYSPESERGSAAAVSALLSTCGYVTLQGEVGFVSENERVAEYFLALIEAFGVQMGVREAIVDPKRMRDKLTFFCAGADAKKLLDASVPSLGAALYWDEDDSALSYLRAAFAGGGSCTLPSDDATTGYHLEFSFAGRETAERFCDLLQKFELFGKILRRGEKFVVYCKSRDAISDFLSVVGAEGALKRFEQVSAAREESNYFNRKGNCDAGNADKTAIASAKQIRALKQLSESGVLQTLPEALRETANARAEYPTLCLQELADRLGITKSCLNHRLRKLIQIYEERESNQ